MKEQNTDNNGGVTELCQVLPQLGSLLWTEAAKYSWPKNDQSLLHKQNKSNKKKSTFQSFKNCFSSLLIIGHWGFDLRNFSVSISENRTQRPNMKLGSDREGWAQLGYMGVQQPLPCPTATSLLQLKWPHPHPEQRTCVCLCWVRMLRLPQRADKQRNHPAKCKLKAPRPCLL